MDWKLYYNNVLSDFREMKVDYPFCYLTIPPTVKPSLAEIRVIAANKELIEAVGGVERDFLGNYSKELHLLIPVDYKDRGCIVYGAEWVKTDELHNEDIHFFYDNGKLIKTKYGLRICVGTPESFTLMKNVILENVRTADNMLIAYAHGYEGRAQFQKNRNRYIPKGGADGKIK